MDYEVRPNAHPISALVRKPVINSHGETLGEVEELMLDLESGCVAYAVLNFSRILEMQSRLFAVPWEAMTLDVDNDRFVLHVNTTVLHSAPGFERDEWPDVTYQYLGVIYDHYGFEHYWDEDEFDDYEEYDYDDDFGFLDGENSG